MKRAIIQSALTVALIVAVIVCAVSSSSRTVSYDDAEISDQLVQEKIYTSYDDIKRDSDIIAIVRINDGLTNKNSTLTYYESGYVKDFWSSREAEVIKVYKNTANRQFDGNVTVMEHIGIGGNGLCYKARLDNPMKRDNRYLVFIKVDDDGKFKLISQEGGKHNLDGEDNNPYLCLNFIFDCELPQKSELAERIKTLSTGMSPCNPTIEDFFPDKIIKTNFGDIVVSEAILTSDEDFYYYNVRLDGDFKLSCIFTNIE